MFKSQTTTWVVTAGALATAAVAVTATQFINAGAPASSGTASSNSTAPGQVKKTDAPAEPPAKSLTLTGSLKVTGLAPGVSVVRTLTIGNPNNQDVVLQSVKTVLSGPSPAPTTGSCSSPSDFEVLVAGYNASTGAGTPVTITKNSSLGVPVTVRMNNSATRNQDPCKGRSWGLTFTAVANSK